MLTHFDNIAAELTAVNAAMIACLGLERTQVVIRPDLALSANLATHQWHCAAHPVLSKLCQVLGSWFNRCSGTFCEVRGHCGDPWNELADAVARHCNRVQQSVGELQLTAFSQLAKSPDLAWAWMLDAPATMHQCLPPGSADGIWQVQPSLLKVPSPTPLQSSPSWHQVSFQCISANVLALGSVDPGLEPSSSSDRALRLAHQWSQQKVQVLGLQETRRTAGIYQAGPYQCFASGALQCQRALHFGCELWLHQDLSLNESGSLRLRDFRSTITHADPRRLLVNLAHDDCQMSFVVLHVPCKTPQCSIEEIQVWWQETIRLLREASLAKLTWAFVDANAPLASHSTVRIGMAGAEPMNSTGTLFEQAIDELQWHAPTTMPWCHTGPHTTWMHPRGHKARRDYVLCSAAAFPLCACSWIDQHHAGGFGHDDHLPVCLQVRGWLEAPCGRPSTQWDSMAFLDPVKCAAFQEALYTLPIPAWPVHVDAHADHFEANLLSLAQQFFTKQTQDRSRPRLAESTRNLIAWKRSCLDYGRQHDLMHDPEFKQQLKFIEADVRRKVHADQRLFYEKLINQLADAGDLHDARTAYRMLTRLGARKSKRSAGRALPMLRSKGRPVQSFEQQQRLWLTQFADVEAGCIMAPSEFRRTLPSTLGLSAADFDFEAIPTLADIQHQVHRLRRGKAPGPDAIPPDVLKAGGEPLAKQLLVLTSKAAAQAREPAAWRTGRLIPLHKGKLPREDPAGYRSIFLNNFTTKVYHSALRKQLVTSWQSVLTHIQMGGRKGVGCDSAHHLIQSHLARSAACKLPSAILFVDFKAAFYSVIRQGLFDHPMDATGFICAMHRLGVHPQQVQQLLEDAEHDVAIQNLTPHATALLRDVLQSTCFEIDGLSEVAVTHRGTRPGDPIGDIAFNLTMALILKEVSCTMQQTPATWAGDPTPVSDFTVASEPAPHSWAEVAYVDDLAILLNAPDNEMLVATAEHAFGAIFLAARKRGLELTYGAGKTELLMTWRGPRSRHYKERVAGQRNQWMIHVEEVDSLIALPVVLSYKHLCTWVHNDGKPLHAIRERITAARKAWGPLCKPFFSKQGVAPHTKIQVFNALVMTRFLFNAHTWSWLSPEMIEVWEAGLRPMLYQLARPHLRGQPPFECDVNTLCGLCEILPPGAQLHLARLRYFKRMVQHCPAVHWQALSQVRNEQGSWLLLLQDSFHWFATFSHRKFGLTADSTWSDWLTVVQMDGQWKGHLKRATKSCIAYHHANARTTIWQMWLRKNLQLAGVEFRLAQCSMSSQQWHCSLCDSRFATKRALAMHAAQKHDYHAVVKHYALDGMCSNCGKLFHCRARLCAHLRHSEDCLLRIRAAFPPMQVTDLEELDEADRQYARDLKQQGWLPTKACLPAVRAIGPCLPPPGSDDAALFLQRWCHRLGHHGSRLYEGLDGFCEHPADDVPVLQRPREGRPETGDLHFIMHSVTGTEHGSNGCFSMTGLARVFAQLHLKTLCFVHFFSGFRREGDIQHRIDNHIVQGHYHVFCISVDFCLQGEAGDLTTGRSRTFWTDQIKSGAVFGGGPPCETYTSARLMEGGPPPVRSFDEPNGLPSNTARQWCQTQLGTTLMQFLIEMSFWCALLGGCSFLEHPAFPLWASRFRPASTWASAAMSWMKRLHCTTFVTFDQRIFDCPGMKPTTLMLVRLPWLRTSIQRLGHCGRCPHKRGFHEALKGRDADGNFKTAIAKIYPAALNSAIADAVALFVQQTFSGCTPPSQAMAEELLLLRQMNFVSRDIVQPDCYLD